MIWHSACLVSSDIMDTQYCFTSSEFYKLAGSGGGQFSAPGLYYFDEDKDEWRMWLFSVAVRQRRLAAYLQEKYSSTRRLQLCVKYKDDTGGTFTYEGKAAAEHAARDLFYCQHDRRDVRKLLLMDERTAEEIYAWIDGEVML